MLRDTGGESGDRPRVWSECFMLCDYASVENGKLYIIGGGWEQVTPAELPTPFAFSIAIKIVVDTELMQEPIRLRVDDVDPDSGQINGHVTELQLDGGSLAGEPDAREFALMIPLALTATATVPGKKRFRLVVNDEAIAFTQFRILPALAAGAAAEASVSSAGTSDAAPLHDHGIG
jgi:hypothetical protein